MNKIMAIEENTQHHHVMVPMVPFYYGTVLTTNGAIMLLIFPVLCHVISPDAPTMRRAPRMA